MARAKFVVGPARYVGCRQATIRAAHRVIQAGDNVSDLACGSAGVYAAFQLRREHLTDIWKVRRVLFGRRHVSLFTVTMNQASWACANSGAKMYKIMMGRVYDRFVCANQTGGVVQLWGYQHGLAELGAVVYRGDSVITGARSVGGLGCIVDGSLYCRWARKHAMDWVLDSTWCAYCLSELHLHGEVVVCGFGMIWPPQCGRDVIRLRQHIRL